jgi:hypothetical protein
VKAQLPWGAGGAWHDGVLAAGRLGGNRAGGKVGTIACLPVVRTVNGSQHPRSGASRRSEW